MILFDSYIHFFGDPGELTFLSEVSVQDLLKWVKKDHFLSIFKQGSGVSNLVILRGVGEPAPSVT